MSVEFKINHPWWHTFFTRLLEIYTPLQRFGSPSRTWVTYYCSKCKLKHVLELNEIDEVVNQKTEEVK